MKPGLALAALSSVALACGPLDFGPLPESRDAGSTDALAALCHGYNKDPNASTPPNFSVENGAEAVLNQLTYVFDPGHSQITGDIDALRKDLTKRLEAKGYKVVESGVYEVAASHGEACLSPDLVGVVLGQEPIVEGKRGDVRKSVLLLLGVETPDGKQAKAGIEAQCSAIVGDMGEKVACVLGAVVLIEGACGELFNAGLGDAHLATWHMTDGSSGMDLRTWKSNVGHASWSTGVDGETTTSSSVTDKCNAHPYRKNTDDWTDRLNGFAK